MRLAPKRKMHYNKIKEGEQRQKTKQSIEKFIDGNFL
jgi:hypothetical protein